MFQLVRTAYEILKDDEERLNYDYMLENPGKDITNCDCISITVSIHYVYSQVTYMYSVCASAYYIV